MNSGLFVEPGQSVDVHLPLPSAPWGVQWPAEFVEGVKAHLQLQAREFLSQWMNSRSPTTTKIVNASGLEVTWDKSGTFSLKVNTD